MPVASPYPPIDLQETDLFSFLFNRHDLPFPQEQVIFVDGNDPNYKYTYRDIQEASIEFGRILLTEYGFRKGDTVVVVSLNDIDYAVITMGTLWAGGVISTASPGYTAAELAVQLSDSGAKMVATQQHLLPTVQKACEYAGLPLSRVLLMGSSNNPPKQFKHWRSIGETNVLQPPRITGVDPKSDLAILVYSSGTEGRPKGVEITHYNVTSNLAQCLVGECTGLSWDGSWKIPGIPDAPVKGDSSLSCLPFFHIYGLLATVLMPLYTGVTTIVMPRFDLEQWCHIVQTHRITYVYIAPPIAVLLSKHPIVSKYDLSSLRMANSAAAPLRKELVEAVYNRVGLRIKQVYGLSETSPAALCVRWTDWAEYAGSVGCLLPNMEAKFCVVSTDSDESEEHTPKEVGTGEVGELYLRGPNVFRGYHNNKAATRQCLSSDGWFRTGDVGFMDANEYIFITDRVKELIKYKGYQVAPAELEGYLIDHELVDDCAVVGVHSDELDTEVPRAYVVRKGGLKAIQEGDDRDIMNWLAARVANHKRLRGGIRFVESIPKSPAGKILRRALKAEVGNEQLAAAAVKSGKLLHSKL